MVRGLVLVSILLNQQAHHIKVPPLTCNENRCFTTVRGLVLVGTLLNQQANNFEVTCISCDPSFVVLSLSARFNISKRTTFR